MNTQNFIPADQALLQMALIMIKQDIAGTNNGKLMTMRLSADLRKHVPALIEAGKLKRATFINPGDSVRVA